MSSHLGGDLDECLALLPSHFPDPGFKDALDLIPRLREIHPILPGLPDALQADTTRILRALDQESLHNHARSLRLHARWLHALIRFLAARGLHRPDPQQRALDELHQLMPQADWTRPLSQSLRLHLAEALLYRQIPRDGDLSRAEILTQSVLDEDASLSISSYARLLKARVQIYHARPQEALKLRQQALDGLKQAFGPEHPDTLGAMHNLAVSLDEKGDKVEALRFQRQAVEGLERVLGVGHPYTLRAIMALKFFEGSP